MKIIEVEIDHTATDVEGSVTHVTLNAQLEDKSWRQLEVTLPPAELLQQQQPPQKEAVRRFVHGAAMDTVPDLVAMQKKPSPVYMKQIMVPFEVETNEGVLTGQPGDYIAHDPQTGHWWPVSAEYVAIHYTGIP